ncbi:hypothetical protein SDC9_149126 [bioreactor metagenome]|uniref:Uncharacterized protein n=1 Tax=bioreactor metagenome TaxID=1076179 RepID=A0A645EMZ7_9ZZZZ
MLVQLAVRYRVDTQLSLAEIRSGSIVFLVPLRILEDMFKDRFIDKAHGEYPFTIDEWQKLCRNKFDPIRKGYYGRPDDKGLPIRWPRRKRKEFR